MDAKTLEALGLSSADLEQKLLDRLVEAAMNGAIFDEEGEPIGRLGRRLDEEIKKRLDEGIQAIGEKHVLPKVAEILEGVCLQATNEWGEAKGKPMTFIQYLVQRAERYMHEKVNFSGESKAECRDSYSWRGEQTRVTHLIHAHLKYSIETALKTALKDFDKHVAAGLAETVKAKLEETLSTLKKLGVKA